MNFNSVLKKNWVLNKYNNQEVIQISEKFSLKEITSRLLSIRNIGIQNVELFLNPTIKNSMPNPYQISDMDTAVTRISESIKRKELFEQEKKREIYKKFKNIFSDGELLEVKKKD